MTLEPTARDILAAVETFGASYHDLHVTIQAMQVELTAARREGQARGEQIASLRRQIDAQFDQAWREIDQIRQTVNGHTLRLDDLAARVSELEARP